MDKEAVCPWCEKKTKPKVTMMENEHGTIKERRCTHCGKVLAAYLADEGSFMQSVRKYEN
ncbi:MAG: hypothetical protein M1398_01640 [Deltaproteobacteria bacterium]|jgi:hypothetical protein|nr:hypothetical protein [Deltaproteobacteria bacterium]